LWNRNGSPPQQIDSYGINNVYFAPNSRLLASTQTDKTIRLWTIGGNPIKTLRGHNAAVNKIAFSSDSKQLISGSLDNTVRLWQVAGSNEKSISLVGRHPSGVYNVHFSPDNKVITSISTTYDPSNLSNPSKIDRYDIQFWNRSGKPLSPFGGKDVDPAILSVMFSSKDLFINSAIISSSDKNDTEPDKNGTDSVGFSSDHRIINLVSRNENSNVSIQFLGQDGRSLRKLSETQVRQVSFSPHQTIAIGNDSGIVELWSWNGTLIKSLKGHTEKVNSVVFSPDGNLLASASDDKTVRLWKSDGTLIRQLDGHAAAVLNVIFSPDSKTLVSSN
jgi:WD40 repeat protein